MAGVNLNILISGTSRKLAAVGIDAAVAEVELILCDLLDVDRLRLYLDGSTLINDRVLKKFDAIVSKRLTRYPLQFILGSTWFYGRKFLVNEDVMAPCPETELLLVSILRAVRFCKSDPVRLLDVGVGAGVVALSAKLEKPELVVTAIDISEEALQVARVNAERFGISDSIRFIRSDLFQGIDSGERFDIIASNPPYIAEDEYDDLPPEVKADPKISLLAGPGGLDVIEPLIGRSPDYLSRPGYLIFEIGDNQADAVFEMVKADGRYCDCSLLKDLNDIDRIVICRVS